jgi:RecA-family ATPase
MMEINAVKLVPLDRVPPRLETFTAAELQHRDFPPIHYVIPGYIVEGLTLLAGKPKLGKSWLALDWALAAAYGGIACGSIKCDWGEVLYCALEDNQRRLQRRLRQLLPEGEWPGRLEIITSLRRLDGGGLDDLRRWIEAAERPRLIVIDTFACVRPTRLAKDNPYDADYAALSPLQVMAGEMGLAIVVVHHVRKLESDDPLDTVSGTTGLTGAADSILVLNRDSQPRQRHRRDRDGHELRPHVGALGDPWRRQ